MSLTIPRLSSQTKASTTPASQTAVQNDMRYRDMGIDDAAIEAMKGLGEAALTAKTNKDTGMANATINEFHRRMDKWYTEATTGKRYKGYDAENIMGDMRKFAYETIDDLKLNGFVKADGSNVPALSEQVYNEKFLPSVDSMLINMDSNATGYSAREIAIAEENDFDANVDRITMTIVGSDDPIVQANASNELNGLYKAYYGGRMRDEARGVAVHKVMSAALGTRAKNLAASAPSRALHEFNTNENYSLYGVDLSEARKAAVEAMAINAGTNEALTINGLNPLPQDWTDQPLGEKADPALRNQYPFSAAGLMTPQEYLTYSVKKAETTVSSGANVANEIRKTQAAKANSILADVGKVTTQDEYNELVEREVRETDAYGMHVLNGVAKYRDADLVRRMDEEVVNFLSTPDGEFNESAALQEANIAAAAKGITFASQEEKKAYEDRYVAAQRINFDTRKERLQMASEGAEESSILLNDFYSKLYTSEAPATPQEIPGIDQMTARDARAAIDALIAKAQTKQAADSIARNEGGSFDVYNLAAQQWIKFDNKSKYGTDGELQEGDAEARQRFMARFVELYIRKHSTEKPNAAELEQLSIEAYNTYKKEPQYDDISKFTYSLRRQAAESYEKPNVTSFEERERLREYLEHGGKSVLTEENIDKVSKHLKERGGYYPEEAISSLPNLSPSWYAKDMDFESEIDQGMWDSLLEIYDKADYNGKETLIDFIVNGDNSSLLRILKAKGKL